MDATVIRRVLAEGQLAIQIYAVDRAKVTILVDHASRTRLEGLGVFLSPPIPQIAGAVEFAPLVVEPMRQLMPDNYPDCSQVYCFVCLWIIKRGLQNARGKIDIVLRWIVRGVDGRGRHAPFALVDWLADLVQIAALLERGSAF